MYKLLIKTFKLIFKMISVLNLIVVLIKTNSFKIQTKTNTTTNQPRPSIKALKISTQISSRSNKSQTNNQPIN